MAEFGLYLLFVVFVLLLPVLFIAGIFLFVLVISVVVGTAAPKLSAPEQRITVTPFQSSGSILAHSPRSVGPRRFQIVGYVLRHK
jgi:hypothetical protein